MKYVLDSSVAVKWVLPEVDTGKALRFRDDFRNAVHELIAPDIFTVEVAHALGRTERQRRIAPPKGAALWHDVMLSSPQLYSSTPLVPRAFAIGSAMRIGIYDCLFVALAEREACELVTSDDKLVKNLGPHFSFIVSLASLP